MDTAKYEKAWNHLRLISNLYAKNLTIDKARNGIAGGYQVKRRITDKMVSDFRLGFARGNKDSEEWEYLIKERELSLELGLIYINKHGSIEPYFRNRLMFPFFDLNGHVIGFTGRDLLGRSKAKYLNTKESYVFQKSIALYGIYQSYERIFRQRKLYLVEGNIDTIRMYEHDYPVVGLSSHDMSDYQINILTAWLPEIYLIMDGDKAGKSGAERITQKFREAYADGKKIRLPRLIELPDGYDPDKFFLTYTEPEDYIAQQAHEQKFAKPIYKKKYNSFQQSMINESSDPEVIKQMNDIVEVIGSRISLERSGANYISRCPFHDEKTASFVVSPGKQIYKCFGCGVSGDVFSFVMKYHDVGFAQAMKMLGGFFGKH